MKLFLLLSTLLFLSACDKTLSPGPVLVLPVVPQDISAKAAAFCEQLPQSQGYYAADNSLNFLYLIDDSLPKDSARYRLLHIDATACNAHRYIFGGHAWDASNFVLKFRPIFINDPSGTITFTYTLYDPVFSWLYPH